MTDTDTETYMAGALAAAHCVASVTKQHVDLELENVGDTADHEADHRVPTCASLLTGRALARSDECVPCVRFRLCAARMALAGPAD